jgi:peptide/nickel transport system substrate-binding protein
MGSRRLSLVLWLALAVVLAACANPAQAPTTSTGAAPTSAPARPATPKRIVIAIQGEPFTLSGQVNTAAGSSTVRGIDELEQMVHAGMATADNLGGLKPQLAEAVPTVENGQWKVQADGRMETTWRIRQQARWHDGMPVTARDFVFALNVARDREMASFRNRAFDNVEGVEAPDDRTVVVRWSRPFIRADSLFSGGADRLALPLPAHLLEQPYTADKTSFLEHPYWSTEFVGAGPFALKGWVREGYLTLQAHDAYVLGRARLDEVEVRFIPDQNALVANVLAGAVEMTLGRSIAVDQAVQVRDQWRDGKVDLAPDSWLAIFPQFINPTPSAISDVRFRRALLHAIDRQEMVETIQSGLASVAHSFMQPNQAAYQAIEQRQVVRHDYDPRRTAQLLEELGLRRGPDGAYVDGTGSKLSVELRASQTDLNTKTMLAVGNYWQRAGITTETYSIPRQLASDDEFRATFPGLEVTRRGNDLRGLPNLHSSQVPLPANRFTGSNNGRYTSPELDALLDAYFVTIPTRDRNEVLGQVLRHLSENIVVLGLFNDPQPVLLGHRLRNIGAKPTPQATQAWNAELWDLES